MSTIDYHGVMDPVCKAIILCLLVIVVLGRGVGFGVQTRNCSGSAEGWRRVQRYSYFNFFFIKYFSSTFELFGCVGTGNAPLINCLLAFDV
jgi:hypothetical protein